MVAKLETLQHQVGNVVLNYRIDGSGPEPLICVHGVGSYLEAWSQAAQTLARRFTVLTYDLRGHGRSSRLKGRYEIDDFVQDLLGLADHVGFGAFHLAGFSLGGLICQRVALTHPARVRRLVLLSTVAGRTSDERTQVLKRLAALQERGGEAHHDASLSRWLTEAFQAAHPQTIAQLRARDAENDPDCYASAYRVLAETDFGRMLDQIRSPTLIVTGADDRGSTPRMAHYMNEQIPGSDLRILPGLRHSILIEAPELVASIMGDFLSEDGHG
ncbi:MAG TPA: alpha/beta fold hydrolase [Caulobacteraceae bacterium]|jgi:pimeloyl-ACP methyl ester carboxylesterase|nr:alpha/beta fold hydrolase [Caulobacteraceae bacterium]